MKERSSLISVFAEMAAGSWEFVTLEQKKKIFWAVSYIAGTLWRHDSEFIIIYCQPPVAVSTVE